MNSCHWRGDRERERFCISWKASFRCTEKPQLTSAELKNANFDYILKLIKATKYWLHLNNSRLHSYETKPCNARSWAKKRGPSLSRSWRSVHFLNLRTSLRTNQSESTKHSRNKATAEIISWVDESTSFDTWWTTQQPSLKPTIIRTNVSKKNSVWEEIRWGEQMTCCFMGLLVPTALWVITTLALLPLSLQMCSDVNTVVYAFLSEADH